MSSCFSAKHEIFNIKKGEYLLFLPDDPSLFLIDTPAKDIISGEKSLGKLSQKYRSGVIKEISEELKLVKKRGFIKRSRGMVFSRQKRTGIFKRLELHLSNECNLLCKYCFAKGGSYGLAVKDKNMEWETARRTLDWFFEQTDNDQEVSIHFFGGEPLLNPEILEKCLKYIDKNHRCFIEKSIGTNGTLFTNSVIGILREYNCIPWVSLDASRQAHNMNRPYKNGRSSFDDIVQGIKKIKELAPDLPIVICSTLGLKDNLGDISTWQRKLKVDQINIKVIFSLYDKCVKACDFAGLMGRISSGLESLRLSCIGENRPFEYLVPSLFYKLHSGSGSLLGCGAGIDRVAVNTDGDVFACSVGANPGTRLANIYQEKFLCSIRKKTRDIYACFERRASECASCWARKLCNGPCVFSRDNPSSRPGVNRICDYVRLTTEFCLKSYASIGYEQAVKMIGLYRGTELALEKVRFLYEIRDLRNSGMKHIRHLTPVLSAIS